MKKYRWVLTAVFAAFLAGTSGCGKKTETIPITTISQSTDDDDPEDNLAASGDSDEIPEYDVDLSKNLNSFQLAIWGDTYEIPESYADFTALGWVYSGNDTKEIQPESFSECLAGPRRGQGSRRRRARRALRRYDALPGFPRYR